MEKNTKIFFKAQSAEFRKHLTEFWLNEKFTDLNFLTSNGTIFKVHKIILSTLSEYFSNLIENITPSSDNIIQLEKKIDSNALKLSLQLLYTGEVDLNNLDASELIKLYEVSILLNLNELKSGVENLLVHQITISNCLELWRISIEHSSDNLRNEFENFIKENAKQFFDKYLTLLSASEIITIFRFNDLNCAQSDLYLYAIKWIKCNFKERRRYIKYIFENICFPDLPIKLFMKYNNFDEDLLMQNRLLNKMILKEMNFDNRNLHVYKSKSDIKFQIIPNEESQENSEISSDTKIIKKCKSDTDINVSSAEHSNTNSKSSVIICNDNNSESNITELSELKGELVSGLASQIKQKKMKSGAHKRNRYETDTLPYFFEMDRTKSRLLITETQFNEINLEKKTVSKLFNYDIEKWFSTTHLDDGDITLFIGGLHSKKCNYFQTGNFHELPPLKQTRWKHSTLLDNNKIYCCGGQSNKTMEIFDLNTLQWIDGPSLQHQRWSFGFVEKDGLLYAIGGYSETSNWDSEHFVEMFDPRTDEWQCINGPNRIRSGSIKAINFNNKILAFKWDRFNQYKITEEGLEYGLSFYYPMNYECFYFEPFEFEDDLYVFGESEDCVSKLFKFNSTSKKFEDFTMFSKSYGHDLHIY